MNNSILQFKPKYSIICLIYKSNEWLDFVYNQVIKYTNFNEVEFFFVANDASQEVKDYLKNNYIPHYIFETSPEQKSEWYINNVYRGYNYGAQMAKGEQLIFINSDMTFSPNWLENLASKYDGQNCIASRLIESGRFFSGKYGIEKDFGTEFFNYKEEEFIEYASLSEEKGVIHDGGLYMPLFINKEDFQSVGGYPEGNILEGSDLYKPNIAKKGEKISYTGDEALIEKLRLTGIKHVTAFDSIVYHFQAGELSYNQLNSVNNKTNICIYNDILIGTMGEKVLWNYLLEKLPGNVYGIDSRIIGKKDNLSKNASAYLQAYYTKTDIIIQNATFISKMENNIPTIAYLQDDIRKMDQSTLLQEENLKNVDLIVTNSKYTQESYKEYSTEIIPIGIDNLLFQKKDQKVLRKKYNIPEGMIGIFVGSLSETKGWGEIESIIRSNTNVDHWIIISKYDEILDIPNTTFHSRVDQLTLSELLNCATFFILGSKVETQCLAGLEAALCDIPIVMRNIGIFQEFSNDERSQLGEFGDDFEGSIQNIIENLGKYTPRQTILKRKLDIDGMIESWIRLISRYIILMKQGGLEQQNKPIHRRSLGMKCEIFIRQRFLGKVGLQNLNLTNLLRFKFYKHILYRILVRYKLYK